MGTQNVMVTVTDDDTDDTHTVTATSSNTSKATVSVSGKTLTITGEAVGSSTIRVTAMDNSGASNATSAQVSFTVYVPPPVPGPITGPGDSTTGNYTLNWGNSTGATSYTLQEKLNNGNWSTVQNTAATTKSFTGKTDGTYGYQVKACAGSTNCSGWTATKTVSVGLNTTPVVAAIANQSVLVNGTQNVMVTVTDDDTDDTHTVTATSSNTSKATVSVSGKTLTITGEAVGSSTIRVTAMDNSGATNDTSAQESFTVYVPPPVPGPITGPGASTDGSYTLNWGSSTGATSYTLQEKLNNGNWSTVQNTAATTKSFTGKTDGTYGYQVKACAGSTNCSGWTATKTVSVGLNTTPVVVAIATQRVSVNGTQNVTVTITDSDAGDTHTVTATSSNTSKATVSVSGKTLTITGEAVGSSTIRVTATDNSGATNATSARVSFTVYVPPPVPGSITGPGASTTGNYTLNWGSSTGATSYTLQEKLNNGNWSTVQNTAATTKSFTGKTDGTYGYQVKACAGSTNCSGWTATKTVSVGLNTTPVVAAIATQRVSVNGTQNVTVTITDSDAGDTHTVTATSSNTSKATVSVSGKTLTITGVAVGSSTIRVTATDNSGASNATSAAVPFTVYVPPPVPGSITGPDASTDGSYTLNWSSSTGATSYTLQELSSGGNWTTVQNTAITSKTFTGKTDGTYQYRAKACAGSTNCSGWTTTHTVTVTLNSTPVIVGFPENLTVSAHTTATVTVQSGMPIAATAIRYQRNPVTPTQQR